MYPSPEAVQQVLAEVAQWTGVATIALMTTSKFVFRYGGWSAAALATPVAILISGVLFFASAIVMQGGGAGVLSPQVRHAVFFTAAFSTATARRRPGAKRARSVRVLAKRRGACLRCGAHAVGGGAHCGRRRGGQDWPRGLAGAKVQPVRPGQGDGLHHHEQAGGASEGRGAGQWFAGRGEVWCAIMC